MVAVGTELIQLAELNALNAMLAIIKYKQHLGFYSEEIHADTLKIHPVLEPTQCNTMKIAKLRPEFVRHVPENLDEGVLYISEEFATAGHLCCCGCGEEVFTPLNPAQWKLTRNARGDTVYPSIGNWNYACRSHYWIEDNRVEDAGPMPDHIIDKVKKRDRRDKDLYFKANNQTVHDHMSTPGLLTRVYRWISKRW